MKLKHRAFQVTAGVSLAGLILLLVLIFNANPNDEQTVLYSSLFLFACIVFYYSSKKYIAYEVKKRKSKRSLRRQRRPQSYE